MKNILDKLSKREGNPLNEKNPFSIKARFGRRNFYRAMNKYEAGFVKRITYGSNILRAGDDLLREYLSPKKFEKKEDFAEEAISNLIVLETLGQNYQSRIKNQIKNYTQVLEIQDRKLDSLAGKCNQYYNEVMDYELDFKEPQYRRGVSHPLTRTRKEKVKDWVRNIESIFSSKAREMNLERNGQIIKNELALKKAKMNKKLAEKEYKDYIKTFDLINNRLDSLFRLQSKFERITEKVPFNRVFYEQYLDVLRIGDADLATA
ncbi:MAG: hypothetical protein Q8Q04_03020 [archaeon]|nr:hypothetical protein [archaeon]